MTLKALLTRAGITLSPGLYSERGSEELKYCGFAPVAADVEWILFLTIHLVERALTECWLNVLLIYI